MEIGIQVSSLKPLLLTGSQVKSAFSAMAALGCRTVQLQWIDRCVPIWQIADALSESGMVSVSVQDFYETVAADLDYYTRLNADTGGKWLCVSRIPDSLKTPEGLDVFISHLQQLQRKLETRGQQLCFHPVSADFSAIAGMDAVEYLLEHMPQLQLCLDLYHLNRSCPDMPGYIRRHGNRICMVHFKDSSGSRLVPAGQGDTNWTGVVSACEDAGIPWAFVEQERWDRDPYDCLKEAMDWISRQRHTGTRACI